MSATKKANKVIGINRLEESEISEEQKVLFESTFNNMNACGKKGNGKFSCYVPVSLLRVDPSYQRIETRKQKKLKQLANNWNEDKLTPIIIVPHMEEYSFYVIDGYGRLLVSTTMLDAKYKALDAIVLTNVPSDKLKRQKFEAELFMSQGSEVERITPIQIHNARLLTGDQAAIDLQNMLNKYELTYVSTPGQRDKAIIGSYNTAYDISKRNGIKCLEFIFSIIENAGWKNEANGYSKTIMKSLKDIWSAYTTPELHKKMHEYMSDVLRETDPIHLISKARTKYSERSEKVMVSLYLADMLIDNLGFEKSEYFEEKKKVA